MRHGKSWQDGLKSFDQTRVPGEEDVCSSMDGGDDSLWFLLEAFWFRRSDFHCGDAQETFAFGQQ